MFVTKKIRKLLKGLTYDISRLDLSSHSHPKQYTCEVCGCYINPNYITEGEPIMKKRLMFVGWSEKTETYIHTPYYCKVHIPTKEEK